MKPSATCARPTYILTGVGGFLPFEPSRFQSIENGMPSSTMKSGFSDWNQPVGTRKQPTIAVAVLLGEQVHEAAGLLEGRPEDHDEHEDHEDHAQAVALDLA